jgi:uncharacterized membrane protein YccF (DUF307 family)
LPPLRLLFNVLWLPAGGVWMAGSGTIAAVAMAVTIIGLPFAWTHLRLARVALWPIGKSIFLVEG